MLNFSKNTLGLQLISNDSLTPYQKLKKLKTVLAENSISFSFKTKTNIIEKFEELLCVEIT